MFPSNAWSGARLEVCDCTASLPAHRGHSTFIAVLGAIVFVLVACGWIRNAQAQSVNTYLANDGDNGTFETAFGEIGPDVGGQIPFTRYGATSHYYQSRWPVGGGIPTFRDEMLLHALDLERLDQDIKTYAVPGHPGTYTILPFIEAPTPGYVAYVEGGAPINATTWWGQTFRMWPYRLNAAPVLICIKTTGLTGGLALNTPPSIQLNNYAAHNSSFGTNKNHTALTSEHYQEFRLPDPEAGWSPTSGNLTLGIEEQALQAGDVVVVCQSIYSENIWFDLQSTMAAENFVRHQFIPIDLGFAGSIGHSYVIGGSWGGVIAATSALLQPRIYAASGGWTFSDFGFGIGDMRDLRSFQFGALAMLPPSGVVVSSDFPQMQAMVDLLGQRFDAIPGTPQWDVALFSSNRRPGEMKVKTYAIESNEDSNANGFWSLDDATINPKFDGHLRMFQEHGAAWGVVPGKNEYSLASGSEWASAITAGATPAADNIDLVPTASAPTGLTPVYPDAYSHTLRHNTHLASNPGFLIPIDLGPAGHPNQPASIKTLGQGVWPGYRDSMRMVDLDGDGKQEVIFGNLDGFVHDLEVSNDANDWYRLDDQYKSQYLGRGTYALAGAGTGSGSRGYFANARGQVWKLTSNNGTNIAATPLIQPDGSFSYDGEIPYIFVGNFDSHHSQTELLLLNRFLDWSLFDPTDGSMLFSGRLQRSSHAVQPGQAAQCDIDGDGDLELLVPAADGHVWKINPTNSSGGFMPGLKPDPYLTTFTATGTPRSLYRVDVANFGTSSPPTNILVFGKNDDLNDSIPATSTNVMMLYDATTTPPTFVGEGSADPYDAFNEAMSFAWITPPAAPNSTAEFVVSGGAKLQKYTVSKTGTFTCTGTCTMVFDPDAGLQDSVTSIAAPPGASANYIVVALGNGRIFLMDPNLQFLRSSDRESPALPNATGWCSNRSLAQCMTSDLVQEVDGGDADLYFADYSEPFRVQSGVSKFRLGRLHLSIGSNPPTWVPYLADIKNPAVEDVRRGANRTLLYRDLDGDGVREAHVFAETGTAYKDTTIGKVREFCTYSYKAPFNYDPLNYPYNVRVVKGGNVFEYFDPAPGTLNPAYNYLSGFNVPHDSTTPFQDFGGSDWWYPSHGANRLSGQIGNYSQSALPFNFGTSMKTAMIRPDSSTSTTVPHVVVGTNGAMVYAIRPGPPPNSQGGCPSQLGYASRCFGSTTIGMDVGDLDGDVDQEIVVGEWMDKGTYVDWLNHNASKNRAHLHILDPTPPSVGGVGKFIVTDLDGDDLLGAGNGIGAGVTGVKIDDYNHDGLPDIWCTDAIGHVYLFKQTTGGLPWHCVYRSTDLGACPGLYNQIYVMKDAQHRTTRLIMISSGYVMAFAVDPSLL